MDIAHLRDRVYHNRHTCAAFGHIAAIRYQNDASLNRMNLAGTHVTENTLHGGGTDNNTAHQIAFIRQVFQQNAVNDVIGQDA